MARNVYEVAPSQGRWSVKQRGAASADSVWDTKPPAIDRSVVLARGNQPSQLIIKRADGTIEDERTYGNDPYPPRG